MEKAVYYFFIFFTEAVILWQYAFTLFAAGTSLRKKPAILCGLYALLFAAAFLESRWLNVALYLAVNFIFLAFWCRQNFRSALFHSTMLTAVMMVCEVMVYYVIRYFAPDYFANGMRLPGLVLFAVCSKLMFFLIVCMLLHILKKRQACGGQEDRSLFWLTGIPLTSVFVMLTFIMISDSCMLSPALNQMLALSAVLLLTANLLVLWVNQYSRKKNAEFTEMQLLLQKEADYTQYYRMLLSQHENQSILIHDIKKHLQSIDVWNDKKEHEKIRAYIRQLMQSSDLRESVRLCDHELLNAILSRCQRQCSDRQIAFHADIRSGILDFLTDADLSSLFCNLLDNARKAAETIPDSFVEVGVCQREGTPFVVVTVVNSCRKDPFEAPHPTPSAGRTGGQRHGFGIKSIRRVVLQYQGDIRMYFDQESLTFHTVLTLKQP